MEKSDRVIVCDSQLLLVEEGEGRFSTVFQNGDGTEERLPVTTPAKDLIATAEIDYRTYRREIKRLRGSIRCSRRVWTSRWRILRTSLRRRYCCRPCSRRLTR